MGPNGFQLLSCAETRVFVEEEADEKGKHMVNCGALFHFFLVGQFQQRTGKFESRKLFGIFTYFEPLFFLFHHQYFRKLIDSRCSECLFNYNTLTAICWIVWAPLSHNRVIILLPNKSITQRQSRARAPEYHWVAVGWGRKAPLSGWFMTISGSGTPSSSIKQPTRQRCVRWAVAVSFGALLSLRRLSSIYNGRTFLLLATLSRWWWSYHRAIIIPSE